MPATNRIRLGVAVLTAAVAAACADPATVKARHVATGDRYVASGADTEAIIEYRNALQQDPRDGHVRRRLADAFERTSQPEKAMREYLRAADLLPGDAALQVKAGQYLLLARQFADARSRAEKVLVKDPRQVDAQVLLANALAGLQQLSQAVQQIETAVATDPSRAASYTNLASLKLATGDRRAAEAAFLKAVEIDPRSVPARLALANFYWSDGRSDEAEETLKAALRLDRDHDLTQRALAMFYLSAGRAAEAEAPLKALADNTKDPTARLTLADYYSGTGRTAEALRVLESLREGPQATEARLREAAIRYDSGEREVAAREVEALLGRDEQQPRALLLQARWALSEGHLDRAAAKARAAVAADPRSADAHSVLGAVHSARREYEEAVAAFSEVLRLRPGDTAAPLALAKIHLARGEARSAVPFARAATRGDEPSDEAQIVLVQALLKTRDVPGAERALQAVVARDRAPALVSAGLIALARNDIAAAQAAFDRALSAEPRNVEALSGRVAVDLARRDAAAARRRVEEHVAAAPNDVSAAMLAATTFVATNAHADAEKQLRRAIALDPDHLPAYSMLGRLYLATNRLDEGRREFEALALKQPRNEAAPTLIGMILHAQNDLADAQKWYERALQIRADAAVAANNLAWLYAEQGGNLDIALQLAQTAKQKIPDHPEVNDTLGWIYVKKGLPSLALRPLQASVAAEPSNATYQYHLGAAYAKLGDTANARRVLGRVLKAGTAFPNAPDARKLLAQLSGPDGSRSR